MAARSKDRNEEAARTASDANARCRPLPKNENARRSVELASIHSADRGDNQRERDRAKERKDQGQFHGWGSFYGSVTRCRCRSRAEALVMDGHRRAKPGPGPQERAVGVGKPQAAMRGRIAP